MVIIPFIYFALLSGFLWYRHKSLDACVFISLLWTFVSFVSILLVVTGYTHDNGLLWHREAPTFGVLSTLLYCVLISITIYPFSLIHGRELKKIDNPAPITTACVGVLLIIVALINLYVVADSTMDILNGNFYELRSAHYKGDMTPAEIRTAQLPAIFGYLLYFNFSTILALPLGFYYLCFTRHKWFAIALLPASLSATITGLQSADRTEIVLFAEMFAFTVVFFHPYFSDRLKRAMRIAILFLAAIFIVYIGAVSAARFDRKGSDGPVASIMKYTGQGFLNYTYFWQHANYDHPAIEREMPIFSHIVLNQKSGPERRLERSTEQGFNISVFPTYLGELILDLSPFGAIIWIIAEAGVLVLIIRRPKREELTIGEVLVIFVLATIPIFGVFYYRLFQFHLALQFWLAIMVWFASKHKITINQKDCQASNE